MTRDTGAGEEGRRDGGTEGGGVRGGDMREVEVGRTHFHVERTFSNPRHQCDSL